MRVFDVGPLLVRIEEALEAGEVPDPNLVEMLVKEGPRAVEEFIDLIDMTKADVDTLANRIKQLQERKAARQQAVERMEGALVDILKRHFPKRDKAGNVIAGFGIKTALVTTWVQSTTTYEVSGADPVKHPQFYKTPEPEFKKSLVIDIYKNATLPEGISVTEGTTESLRVKR